MAIQQVFAAGVSPLKLYQDSALGAVAQAISGSAIELKEFSVDNEDNAFAVYFKAWDDNAPTVGTDAPTVCHPVGAGLKDHFLLNYDFPTGLAVACIKHVSSSDGPGTSGTTAPGASVPVEVITD